MKNDFKLQEKYNTILSKQRKKKRQERKKVIKKLVCEINKYISKTMKLGLNSVIVTVPLDIYLQIRKIYELKNFKVEYYHREERSKTLDITIYGWGD